jgi:hypothetical protein
MLCEGWDDVRYGCVRGRGWNKERVFGRGVAVRENFLLWFG